MALELEQACDFKFDSDVFAFIVEIGNLSIGADQIIIAEGTTITQKVKMQGFLSWILKQNASKL